MKRARAVGGNGDDDDDGGGGDYDEDVMIRHIREEEALRQASPGTSARVSDSALAALLDQDASSSADTHAPAPAPVSVHELRRGRAQTSGTGSGSVAAMTAAWREEARQQQAETLGYDPELARHAWSNSGPTAMRAAGHPLIKAVGATGEAEEEHRKASCPLCVYTILPTSPADVDDGVVDWEDVRQGLSVMLGRCGDTISRDQAIAELLVYYQKRVVEPLTEHGTPFMPLTHGITLGHIKDVVFNPTAKRKESVSQMDLLLAMSFETSARLNAITGQCTMDAKTLNAYSRLVLTRETVLDKIERAEAEARAASSENGEPPPPKRGILGWRFVKSNTVHGQPRGPSQFPGAN
jgi:hypothetical protein